MHCPSCGAMAATGLRYCKRCGGDLSTPPGVATVERARQTEYGWEVEKIEPPGVSVRKLASIFWAVAIFSMVSLIVLFGISVPLTLFSAPRQLTVPLYLFGSAAVVLIAGMLIRQVSRLIRLMENESRQPRPAMRGADQPQPQIQAPLPPFRSVTEHTTRNFDAVRRDPASGE